MIHDDKPSLDDLVHHGVKGQSNIKQGSIVVGKVLQHSGKLRLGSIIKN